MLEKMNLLGAIVALIIYISSILTFISRLLFRIQPGHWIGYPLLLMAFPLGYLLLKAPQLQRPMLYLYPDWPDACLDIGGISARSRAKDRIPSNPVDGH